MATQPVQARPDAASRFLSACARRNVDATPVWFMRQAGRALPAYRRLRERYGFLDLVREPDLIAEITRMPIDELGVDAAVLFADIMLPLWALGVDFQIVESVGPVIEKPIRTREQVDSLARIPVAEVVPAVLDGIRALRRDLPVPLIGFAGAPFTLACYLIEGKPSRDYTLAKTMLYREPDTWHALMDRLTELVIEYIADQVRAGVQAVQLFDSWVGALAPQDAQTAVMPYVRRIFESVTDVPKIAFGTNTATLLPQFASSGADVVSVDWRVPLDEAWKTIGYDLGIQGNLEPAVLLGDPPLIRERVHDVLRRANGRPGHIFNLGHGVLPSIPVDSLKLVVDTVHEWQR